MEMVGPVKPGWTRKDADNIKHIVGQQQRHLWMTEALGEAMRVSSELCGRHHDAVNC